MSLRVQKTFGVRSDTSKNEPKRKFIFAFEGEKTEKQYFNAIADCKAELGISDIIDIQPLERTDASRSN